MFELVILRFAIGKGWFSDQQGFSLELDCLSINLFFSRTKRDFQGSLIAIYFDIWREDGKLEKEFSWDLLYLRHFLKKKALPASKVL